MKKILCLVYGATLLLSSNSCKKDNPNPIAIGKPYQGGIIGYIDDTGQHGLIVAEKDQGMAPSWGCWGVAIDGANGSAIGTGAQNTKDIINGCNTAGIAARICDNLVLNGYDDWYLPSIDELEQLAINKETIGGFANEVYWTSTEEKNLPTEYAKAYNFYLMKKDSFSKNLPTAFVRAVRSF